MIAEVDIILLFCFNLFILTKYTGFQVTDLKDGTI